MRCARAAFAGLRLSRAEPAARQASEDVKSQKAELDKLRSDVEENIAALTGALGEFEADWARASAQLSACGGCAPHHARRPNAPLTPPLECDERLVRAAHMLALQLTRQYAPRAVR